MNISLLELWRSMGWFAKGIVFVEGIYPDRLIRQNKKFGHYLLYRVGITERGDWIFYIAGD